MNEKLFVKVRQLKEVNPCKIRRCVYNYNGSNPCKTYRTKGSLLPWHVRGANANKFDLGSVNLDMNAPSINLKSSKNFL